MSQKKLSLIPLTMLVTGNMMGSGIFLLPASLAEIGSVALLGWIATSIGAIALSLLFVRLRSLNPHKIGLVDFRWSLPLAGNSLTRPIWWTALMFPGAAYTRLYLKV